MMALTEQERHAHVRAGRYAAYATAVETLRSLADAAGDTMAGDRLSDCGAALAEIAALVADGSA